jgi:hypothetical protein
MLVCSASFTLAAFAADPSWWSSPGTGSQPAVMGEEVVTNDGLVSTNYITNAYAVVVQGQLKQFTARAVDEMNAYLPGGAGTNLNNLVAGWSQDYATNNYSATNNPYAPYKPSDFTAMTVGQLKQVGSLVWSQLVAQGYTNAMPSWLAGTNAGDYSAANIGQLKTVFNFDLASYQNTVTGLTITVNADGSVTLNWTLSSGSSGNAITIVGIDANGNATVLDTLSGSATTDTLSAAAVANSVAVGASNAASSPISSASAVAASIPAPPPPTALTGTIALLQPQNGPWSENMNLSWTASAGATGYVIDRETVATGSWTHPYDTSSTASYTDTGYTASEGLSGGYHYRVSATNGGVSSAPSNEYPLSRYAVIDLGAGFYPSKINNAGYVLSSGWNAASVWHNGQVTTLQPANPTDGWLTYDISETGIVTGYDTVYSDDGNPYDFTNYSATWSTGTTTGTVTANLTTYDDSLDGVMNYAANDAGDAITMYRGIGTYDFYFNSTSLNFWPTGISNRMTTGTTTNVYVAGFDTALNQTVWWDEASGTEHTNLITGAGLGLAAINAATATVLDSNGNPIVKPAVQIVGGSSLWEMNPATGIFGPPSNLQDLLPAGAGWSAFGTSAMTFASQGPQTMECLNDYGAIVGTATSAADGQIHGVMLLPVDIEPDAGQSGTTGDLVPSIRGTGGQKHYVSPKQASSFVVLKANIPAFADENFSSYFEWDTINPDGSSSSAGQAVSGSPDKWEVKRDTPGQYIVRLKTVGNNQEVARINIWIVWAHGSINNNPTPTITSNTIPNVKLIDGSQSNVARIGDSPIYEFVFTISPSTIFAVNNDIPDLTGPKDPAGDNEIGKGTNSPATGLDLSGGANDRWDVSRRSEVQCFNPNLVPLAKMPLVFQGVYNVPGWPAANLICVSFPNNPLIGNDDSTFTDEDNNPYAVGANAHLIHDVGQIASKDSPSVGMANSAASANYSFEQDDLFQEFARLEIGQHWYLISSGSDDILWNLKSRYSVNGGVWIDNGSTTGTGN